MKKNIVSSLGEPVGKYWAALQKEKTSSGLFYVASPTSSTPLPIYDWIVKNSESFGNWENFRFVLMDEMLEGSKYVSIEDPASYEKFENENFLNPLGKRIGFVPEIIKPEIDRIETFETQIDLLVLALGIGGNYANVMPGTAIEKNWYISHLTDDYRQFHTNSNSNSYAGANFREYGMSLGPQQVLAAEKVLVIISGEKKKELARQLFTYSSFSPNFPLSIIYDPKVSDRVEIFITEDAV